MNEENRKSILLVEDDFIIAMTGKKSLEKYGYRVTTVATGEKAVGLFNKQDTFDLILMDIDLGSGIDGTETAEIILKNNKVPIVFHSSHIEPEIVEKTEKITSYGYAVKNSGITVLDASIKMAFKLFEANKKIAESEERYKKAQAVSHIGSWVWNIKTNKLDWTDEMYRIFGIERETFTGLLTDVIAKSIHPDDQNAVDASNRSVIEKGIPIPLEYRVVRSDGTTRIVWAEAGEMILDKDGKPSMLTGIIQDITEHKLAEDEIKNKLNELLQFQRLTVGRELKMIELKKEINQLLTKLGKEEKYRIIE